MQVKVRALIWHHDRVVVARESRRGEAHLSLPGDRPKRGELLLDALAREVLEETGVRTRVGRLLYVAECVNSYGTQDLNLVFAAAAIDPVDENAVLLVDPAEPATRRSCPRSSTQSPRTRPGRPPRASSATSGGRRSLR